MSPDEGRRGQERSSVASSSSEVVVIDQAEPGRHLATNAVRSAPQIANLNVSKNSILHIGPKIVTVHQNVQNNEVVNGRVLGLEFVSRKSSRRLRCSVAVFVCWTIVVAIVLIVYLVYYLLSTQPTRLDIDLRTDWYLRRADWQSMDSQKINFLKLPVNNVVVGHSAMDYCDQKYQCMLMMIQIQIEHLRRGYDDIGPNFFVGGKGWVYEGRGANVVGLMVASWNLKSISIMFHGDYSLGRNVSDQAQFDNLNMLLDVLVQEGVLVPDYVVYGSCQLHPYTITPGPGVMKNMHNFKHWDPINASTCLHELSFPRYIWHLIKSTTKAERVACLTAVIALILCIVLIVYFTAFRNRSEDISDPAPHAWNITRESWLAQTKESDPLQYEPVLVVIIEHTVITDCYTFIDCAAELRNLQSTAIIQCDYDVAYNFVIGNDGRVYEGRGWRAEGAHIKGLNRCSLGIGFIGDYRRTKVTDAQILHANLLLENGVKLGYLDPDYVVIGACDYKPTTSPGTNLYNAIQKWEHYDPTHKYKNKSCEEIYEQSN